MIGPSRVSYDIATSRHAERLEQAATRQAINEARRAAAGTPIVEGPITGRVASAVHGFLASLPFRRTAGRSTGHAAPR
ncbi:MAG TPA: hypothetical protein VLA76_06315 [Candidatus Angelobacter sp.]|nr:hypothetical protein [Candidatus Angelobacter sp.]